KQERKRASLRSDGKTGKEVSTDELNASMPIRSVHAAEYGCPQLTPCGRHRLERVVGIDWNAWSPSVGTRGRFQWNTQCGADLSGDLDLHQLLYQRTHRFAKEVHIRSGLVKKLLQRDANVGGHGGFLLPCCCCSNTHGTRSWPLASREQPPSGIYTTTWDSSEN